VLRRVCSWWVPASAPAPARVPLLGPRALPAPLLLLLGLLPGVLQAQESAGSQAEPAEAESANPAAPAPAPTYRSLVEAAALPGGNVGARTELTPERLAAKGARTLADALTGEPGLLVSVAPEAGTANTKQEQLLSLRGFDGADLLVLVDGAPIADPDSGLVDLGLLSLDGVSRVVVVRGPSSLLYGPGAMAGVVHLETGPPAADRWLRLGGELDGELGYRLQARGGLAGARGYASLAASLADSPGFPLSADFEAQRHEEGERRENSDRFDRTVRARGELRLAGVRLLGGASHTAYQGGVPFAIADPAPSNLWRRGWERTALDLGLETRRFGPLRLLARAYGAHQLDTLTSYTDTRFTTILDDGDGVSTHDGWRLGLLLAPSLRWPAQGLELTLGYHHQLDLAARQDARGAPWADYRNETLSLALEAAWRPHSRLKVVGGASVVGFFKEQAAGAATGEDVVDHELLLGLEGALGRGWLLRAGGARKVGFPTLKRLYGTLGNPDLRTQRALLLDAGLLRAPGGPWQLEGELSVFVDAVQDLVGKAGTLNEVHYANVGRARLAGVEAALGLRPWAPLGLELSGSWLQAQDLTTGRTLATLDYRPCLLLSGGGRVRLPWRGGQLGARYRLVGERAYQLETTTGADGLPEVRTLPWYGIVDAQLAQELDLGQAGRLLFAADLFNLADTYREDAAGRPGPGRWFRIGAEIQY